MPTRQLPTKLHIMPTTKAFLREARSVSGMGVINTLHGYIYGRWPFLIIELGTGEHRLMRTFKPIVNLFFRAMMRFPADNPLFDKNGMHPGKKNGRLSRTATFADTYHGKVIRLKSAQKIVSVHQKLTLTNLEHVIPYSLARDIVLAEKNRIALLDCPCRAARSTPCRPLDVCMVMGDPFVDFVAEHHQKRSRIIDRQEAIDILSAEAERGHVHHAFFKEAAFGRFFAICNWCDCCCGAMQALRNGIPMLASSGYINVVERDQCEVCGTCVSKCPFHAIQLIDSRIQIDPAQCMGCGVCSGFCPVGALTLKRDYTRSDPLEIDQLMADAAQQ